MAESSTATQQMPSTSTYSLSVAPILAEIRVENISASVSDNSGPSQSQNSPTTTATAQVALIPSSSQVQAQVVVTSNTENNDKNNNDEPEAKRKKLEHTPRLKKLEKLENRLGSVLCCAVCLDLPKKTAMYQVSIST
jgi:hypothetical protein